MENANDLMMTDADLARAVRVSRRQVWNLLSRGLLPEPVRLGRSVRWRRSDIEKWIAGGCKTNVVIAGGTR